jgi:hypothetical protein
VIAIMDEGEALLQGRLPRGLLQMIMRGWDGGRFRRVTAARSVSVDQLAISLLALAVESRTVEALRNTQDGLSARILFVLWDGNESRAPSGEPVAQEACGSLLRGLRARALASPEPLVVATEAGEVLRALHQRAAQNARDAGDLPIAAWYRRLGGQVLRLAGVRAACRAIEAGAGFGPVTAEDALAASTLAEEVYAPSARAILGDASRQRVCDLDVVAKAAVNRSRPEGTVNRREVQNRHGPRYRSAAVFSRA